MVLMRPTLRRPSHQVTLSLRPRATVLLRALPATRARRIGAWCHISTQPQVIIRVIIVQGGSRVVPSAIRTPIPCSMKFRHLMLRRTRHIAQSATLVNIRVAMVVPLTRNIKNAANQVAIKLVAVAFRLEVMTKELGIADKCHFSRSRANRCTSLDDFVNLET
jgi:hypothetical protein